MINKNIFLKLQFVFILISPNIAYSQFCPNAVVPPTTINGIKVTATYTGSVSVFPNTGTSCNLYTTPTNSIWIGQQGAFNYTMNFSFPVNKLNFVIIRTGISANEVFTFNTDTGIPTIVDQGSCFTTISNNVITSGNGAPGGGGGGNFTVKNTKPFSSLTISGAGGVQGSFLAICSSSVLTKLDTTIEICTGDSALIYGEYQKLAGLYSDTIFGGSSTGEDSVIVTNLIIKSISFDLGNDTTLCQGEVFGLNASTPNASYLWQDNSTTPTFNVSQKGRYWVQVTVNNCNAIDTIQVNYNPLPAIDIKSDTAICQGEIVTLDASTPNATYLWQDNSTSSTFNVTQQGSYWVQVTVNKCSAIDTVLINEKDCEILLQIPNVITPNGDGINDLFVPIISKGIVSTHTIIYNRWGVKLYETNNPLIEWSAKTVSDGVYFWIINYTSIKGVGNKLSGYVTVLKSK